MAPLIEESPPDATNESQNNQAQLSRLVSQLELNKQSNYVLNILYYISGCSKAHETSEMLLMYWWFNWNMNHNNTSWKYVIPFTMNYWFKNIIDFDY